MPGWKVQVYCRDQLIIDAGRVVCPSVLGMVEYKLMHWVIENNVNSVNDFLKSSLQQRNYSEVKQRNLFSSVQLLICFIETLSLFIKDSE